MINRGDQGQFGTVYKIVYETTQQFANAKTCFAVPGGSGANVTPQGVLPNTTMYQVHKL